MEIAENTLTMGEYTLRFEDEEDLEESYREKAEKELRETETVREQALEALKELLRGEENLEVPLDDDKFLLSFLRPTKFYPKSAFERACKLFKLKEKNMKYLGDLLPSNVKTPFAGDLLTVFPFRDQHGRRILLIEAGQKWNPKEVTLTDLIRGVMLIVEAAVKEHRTQISGAVIIIDVENMSLSHVWQFSPGVAKFLLEWVQDCIPVRIKAVHIVNQPYIFNMVFSIFKPFIREKLRNRIVFHGDSKTSLLDHIDAKALPSQYGGLLNLESTHGMGLHGLLSSNENLCKEIAMRGYISKKKSNKNKS